MIPKTKKEALEQMAKRNEELIKAAAKPKAKPKKKAKK